MPRYQRRLAGAISERWDVGSATASQDLMSRVRELILETSSELFYNRGSQAVSMDAIIARADVARMSFYRHLQSPPKPHAKASEALPSSPH